MDRLDSRKSPKLLDPSTAHKIYVSSVTDPPAGGSPRSEKRLSASLKTGFGESEVFRKLSIL